MFDIRDFDAFPNSRVTLTNLDSKKTLTVSIAGPGHIQFGATEASLGKHRPVALVLQFRGTPGITLLNGRFVRTFDALGNETSFSSVGRTRDLCAELAG